MSVFERGRQRRRRNQNNMQGTAQRNLQQAGAARTGPVVSRPGQTSPGTTRRRGRGTREEQRLERARAGVGTGLRGIGQTAEGLFDQKADAITRAAKARSAAARRGAEQSLAADVGRSARMARGGGRGEMLADVGAGLQAQAAADAASAEERAIDTRLEKQQFMAEKYVSPAEAQQSVESFIEGIESQYRGVFGDDEEGIAKELERYASRQDISETEREYALEQARKFRLYEEDMFASGGRGLGSI